MVTDKQKANLRPPIAKGEVRNPKGKPKGSRNFKTVIREFLDNVDVMIDGKKSDGYMALVATLYKKATTHEDVGAIREIMDRLEGKAAQNLELSNKDNKPLEVEHSHVLTPLQEEALRQKIAENYRAILETPQE